MAIDDLKYISITDLKKWHYLDMGSIKSGVLNWRNRFDEVTSSISIKVVCYPDTKYLQLKYKCNEIEYNYKVMFVSVPSNLGFSNILYFECPYTKKRCRKLHLIQGKFIHRSALKRGLYSKQSYSKKYRQLEKVYGSYFELEQYYEQLNKKHFKKYYKGKPTKRYLKLINKIQQANKVSISEFEKLFAC